MSVQPILDLFAPNEPLPARPRVLGLSKHLTHKANLKQTRYGWLRLTPAYSVHLVASLLDNVPKENLTVLDPFCGTGTTALVCAEQGIIADTTDINPFLIWLASVKTRRYSSAEVEAYQQASQRVIEAIVMHSNESLWVPHLHQIEKWWDERTLQALGRAMHRIAEEKSGAFSAVTDLLLIVFCRTMIDSAHVSFGHQSMSFKKDSVPASTYQAEGSVTHRWKTASDDIYHAAMSEISIEPRAILCDARHLTRSLLCNSYDVVITSPPYPNRMSYIRELRPYMYWLGFLQDGRGAGELDWQAIGGTWGCATSYVAKWMPPVSKSIPYQEFDLILSRIAERSDVLSRYVHKYFYDMIGHLEEVFAVLKPGGIAHYIVGNSKFYDVLLPVEEIFASLFQTSGFEQVVVKTIRKRTSKKELYEYCVSARKPQ